jgi:hypothetical protein
MPAHPDPSPARMLWSPYLRSVLTHRSPAPGPGGYAGAATAGPLEGADWLTLMCIAQVRLKKSDKSADYAWQSIVMLP